MSKDLFTHLILKSFQGTITAEEKTQLESWLAEEVSHRDLFDQLKMSWQEAESYKKNFHVDLDKGWKSIQKRINQAESTPVIIPFWKQPALRIAASLVLLVGMAWAAFHYLNGGATADQYASIVTAENEVTEITLPDGSTVWLNENSSLSYPTKFFTRDIELSGEAQFEVKHDAEHPFTVNAAGTRTTVLGTIFDIHATEAAVRVSLIEGSIAFASSDEQVVLVPGETVNYDAQSGQLTKDLHTTQNFNSWKTGELTFQQKSIAEVIADMEAYFDITVDLENNSAQECLFTGTFNKPTFDEIVDVLSFTYDLTRSQREGHEVLIIHNCQ
jgi:ferric-dicitrate binding protein FerR (iron transport regulator)